MGGNKNCGTQQRDNATATMTMRPQICEYEPTRPGWC